MVRENETKRFKIWNKYMEQIFGYNNYIGQITLNVAERNQYNLNMWKKNVILTINKRSYGKNKYFFVSVTALYESWELTRNAFKNGIFPIKATKGKGIKISTPKEMFKGLAIALANVKASNTSEKLQNEVRQKIDSLYWAREITKKNYNNIMNSIKVKYKNECYIYQLWK